MIELLTLLIGLFTIYFLPTILRQKKKNVKAIFILNLLLGWTFVGWVILVIWADDIVDWLFKNDANKFKRMKR